MMNQLCSIGTSITGSLSALRSVDTTQARSRHVLDGCHSGLDALRLLMLIEGIFLRQEVVRVPKTAYAQRSYWERSPDKSASAVLMTTDTSNHAYTLISPVPPSGMSFARTDRLAIRHFGAQRRCIQRRSWSFSNAAPPFPAHARYLVGPHRLISDYTSTLTI
jgi:hypothetical protein